MAIQSVYMIKHISMFYLEVSIQLMDIIYEKWQFFLGAANML